MKTVAEICRPARPENLTQVLAVVTAAAAAVGVPQGRRSSLELAVEEAVVNICRHAYPAGEGDFTVRCLDDDGRFIVEIVDSGIPFDPTAIPDPDIRQDVASRQVGGLGVYFIKKFADEVVYRRDGIRNLLRFSVARE